MAMGYPHCPVDQLPTPPQAGTCGHPTLRHTTASIGSIMRRPLWQRLLGDWRWRQFKRCAGHLADSWQPVYTSADCPGSNAIDPASIVDASGNAWLAFGSYGRRDSRLCPSTTPRAFPPARPARSWPTTLPGPALKGPTFIRTAASTTCSHRSMIVARALPVPTASLLAGPARQGPLRWTAAGSLWLPAVELFWSAHGNINGPGGESVFTDTRCGGAILVYHYYDGNNSGYPALGLNVLAWTSDGWPYLQ